MSSDSSEWSDTERIVPLSTSGSRALPPREPAAAADGGDGCEAEPTIMLAIESSAAGPGLLLPESEHSEMVKAGVSLLDCMLDLSGVHRHQAGPSIAGTSTGSSREPHSGHISNGGSRASTYRASAGPLARGPSGTPVLGSLSSIRLLGAPLLQVGLAATCLALSPTNQTWVPTSGPRMCSSSSTPMGRLEWLSGRRCDLPSHPACARMQPSGRWGLWGACSQMALAGAGPCSQALGRGPLARPVLRAHVCHAADAFCLRSAGRHGGV